VTGPNVVPANVCRCKRPLIRMDLVSPGKRLPLVLCAYCDMGTPAAGPPILMEYLRKGHR
jgi:hypothetical protein